MKLTRPQRDLLGRLAEGAHIVRIGGSAPMQYLSTTGKHVGWQTATILLRAGLIEAYKEAPHELDPSYRITEAGRRALGSR